MKPIGTLLIRNVKLFLRDKATVFFSLFSTLIIIALYFLFIAKIYTASMDNPDLGGISMLMDDNGKNLLVYLQMMAGVMVLNSMSLATGAFSTIAKDFENKRIDSFLLTPVKTYEMILAYFSTGLVVSFAINSLTWALSYVIIGVVTGYWLAAGTFFMVLLVLFVASLISCSFMLLMTTLVKSSSAIGVFNGVAGTLFGFMCGIYMPYSNLGEGMKAVGSFIPFTHLTIWLKRVVLDDACRQLSITGEVKNLFYREFFSAESIGFCTLSVPLWGMLLASGLIGLAGLYASWVLLAGRIKGKRKA